MPILDSGGAIIPGMNPFSRAGLAALSFALLLPLQAPVSARDPNAAKAPDRTQASDATAPARPEAISLDEIRRFVAVFRAVKEGYVDQLDDAELMRAAIRGLLIDLDPHSVYLDAEQSRELDEAASGTYGGLGLEVSQRADRSLLVIAPIDDSPAARAGIRAGDIITAIDGKPIGADSVDGAVDSMRGEAGTRIELSILREGTPEPLHFSLTREIIRIASVRGHLLQPDYAYLRIAAFQADTGLEVERTLKQLIQRNRHPLRGLVLDLRSNPGGLLNPAVEAADAFLDGGVIVSTRGRLPHSHSELKARKGDLLDGAPIAILVDGGTASAAEVLAGALRDHRRAVVLGSTTFGKGSVQTVLSLDNGDSIKVTTARYYTPSGHSIQATGIVPDVQLEPRPPSPPSRSMRSTTLRERDLPGHLRGENEPTGPEAPAPSDATPKAAPDAASETAPATDKPGTRLPLKPPPRAEELNDSAVREALNLLKGLAVFRD